MSQYVHQSSFHRGCRVSLSSKEVTTITWILVMDWIQILMRITVSSHCPKSRLIMRLMKWSWCSMNTFVQFYVSHINHSCYLSRSQSCFWAVWTDHYRYNTLLSHVTTERVGDGYSISICQCAFRSHSWTRTRSLNVQFIEYAWTEIGITRMT